MEAEEVGSAMNVVQVQQVDANSDREESTPEHIEQHDGQENGLQ